MRRLMVVAVVAVLVVGACGKDKKAATTGGPLSLQLPAKVKSAGVLRIGSDIEYPPVESYKEGTQTPEGIDIDLGNAIARKLGLTAQFVNDTDFAGIITALQADRFDIIMSAMNDTAERRGKGVHFVDYFTAGTSILVAKGNPQHITKLSDLCGKTIAVQKGTVQETDTIPPQQQKCTDAKLAKITVTSPEKDTDTLLAVKTGRAVATLEDSPVAAYNAKTSGAGKDFEVVGDILDVGKYGIAVPADCPGGSSSCTSVSGTQLLNAVRNALKAVIADGTYDTILTKWGATGGALKTADLDGGA